MLIYQDKIKYFQIKNILEEYSLIKLICLHKEFLVIIFNLEISLVLGSCTAGGAYVPAMSDENIIVH